jgi:hypothetical protein
MSSSSSTEVNNYEPNDNDIDQVLNQLSTDVPRDTIIQTLKRTKGDICEAVLIILTDDNVIPKQSHPTRLYPKLEVLQWEQFFKEVDDYNIKNNISGLQNRSVNDPLVQSSLEFENNNLNQTQ